MITGLCRTAAAVVLIVGLAACGGGTTVHSGGPSHAGGGSQDAGAAMTTRAVEADQPEVQREEFPAELVGVWLHAKENSPERIEFGPTGEFRTRKVIGTAVVHGSTMVMQVDG